jgi:uncharacterized membrane protein HdeD (DUF308 family)
MGTASPVTMSPEQQLAIVSVRDKWGWILALGATLVLCGFIAITFPTITSAAASAGLGLALTIVGIVKIAEAFKVKEWDGFSLRLVPGIAEVAGGILIYVNPFKWALAITLLASVVFAVQGVTQIGLALRARPKQGWGWLLLAGVVALCAGIVLTMKLRYTRYFEPSTIGGIALFIAGFAYIVIAFAVRRTGKPV